MNEKNEWVSECVYVWMDGMNRWLYGWLVENVYMYEQNVYQHTSYETNVSMCAGVANRSSIHPYAACIPSMFRQ